MENRRAEKERAVLMGTAFHTVDEVEFGHEMDELARLAETAGAVVTRRLEQHRGRPSPSIFIGRGKLEELQTAVAHEAADLVVFLDRLSPVQLRNLSDKLGVRVLDRVELILDIFAQHAKSRDGKLQVELAQLRYLLPRLVGKGIILSRQGGGIGTRGPGETQLEVDRRKIGGRITKLRKDVEKIAQGRRTQRASRRRQSRLTASLVGYTNAGKSTLLNRLAGADIEARDQLFSTLDPTTRRVSLPSGRLALITDTVGFIRDLPEELAAAFRAALEEIQEADLLLHVVDTGSEALDEEIEAVDAILKDLEVLDKPRILVFNKWDTVDAAEFSWMVTRHEPAAAVSAREGTGIDELMGLMDREAAALGFEVPHYRRMPELEETGLEGRE